MAFVNDDAEKATSLVAKIQKLTEDLKAKDVRAFVVFQSGPESKEALESLAEKGKITIPLTFLPKGKEDSAIPQMKINPQAKNTVVVYNQQKVHATFVNVDDASFAKVAEATQKMVGN
jgi:uncharacterized membrane protein